jgi:uncharacterized protein (TIGR02246 family)
MKIFIAIAALALSVPAFATDQSDIEAKFNDFATSWNKHDAHAMAMFWAKDGDVINPAGVYAKGQDEIEKLLTTEHGGMMKGTTMKVGKIQIHEAGANFAFVDADMTIEGMMGPGGKAMKGMKHHGTMLFEKKDGQWAVMAARPYVFMHAPAVAKAH